MKAVRSPSRVSIARNASRPVVAVAVNEAVKYSEKLVDVGKK
jgi:formylglycine-generating enzyme required for sulfatase activity